MNIKPSQTIEIMIGSPDEKLREMFSENVNQVARLARASGIGVKERLDAPRASARAVLAGGAEVAVPLEGLIDFAQERARLERERDKLQKEAARLEAQLANPQFTERAPVEKVDELRERLADITQRLRALAETLEALR
jgi:valyl-tRNA synthetase